MEILNLTLQNFKGHADECFKFTPGTNAICGENGAGKTSIFEAIAWVLFDHCDYQKKELIRTGAASANAAVEFISSLDGRCYRVKRNTQRGYELYDPQLDEKLNIKKLEDVQLWLKEHLGVPRNTELSRLFAETIGIPQGTFTADFLKRPGDRKKIFDPILKVEDYKQTYEKTRNLEAYAKGQVSQIQQALEVAQVKLADWNALKAEQVTLTTEIDSDQQTIAQTQAQLTQQQQELAQIQAIAQQLEQLNHSLQRLEQQKIRTETQYQQTTLTLQQAQQSAQICDQHQADFAHYQEIQTSLQQLQQRRQQQQHLLKDQTQLHQKLSQAQIQTSTIASQLEGFAQLEARIKVIQPLLPQQQQLEEQRQTLQQQLQSIQVQQGQRQSLAQQLDQLSTQLNQLKTEIDSAQHNPDRLHQLPALEAERQGVMKSLGHWEISQVWLAKLQPIFAQGKTDRDRHRSAVQTALQVIESTDDSRFDPVAEALKEGAILNTGLLKAMHQLLTELDEAASPERLNQKLHQINGQIQQLQQVQQQMSVLEAKQQQMQAGDRQRQALEKQLETLADAIAALPELEQQRLQLDHQLTQLGNPQAEVTLLQRQLQEKGKLEQQQAKLQETLAQLEKQQQNLEQALKPFESLEMEFTQAQSQLTQAQPGYQLYLQHQTQAQQVEALTAQLQAQEEMRSQLAKEQLTLAQQRDNLQTTLDLEAMQALNLQVQESQIRLGQLQGGLQPKLQRLEQVQSQLQERQQVFEQTERDRQTLSHKQDVLDLIQEARRIYNQSGPRISELYQQEISFEADRLFRELLHRQDVALRWTEDYDIQVQDQGHWRTFKSLSGGEQMCAALAVRLALLKTLGDINVAFFDEPTTNMDGVRRSQLAEAISNLKSFHQLFVISHDDTFETITESIIRLKSKGE